MWSWWRGVRTPNANSLTWRACGPGVVPRSRRVPPVRRRGIHMTKLDEAKGWLVELLAEPRPARDVQAAAMEAGITKATLRRAAELVVCKELVGEPGSPVQSWVWSLSSSAPE